MSGFGSEEDLRLSLEAGFAIHLTKPIDIARLEAAIQQFGADADRKRTIAEACHRPGNQARCEPVGIDESIVVPATALEDLPRLADNRHRK
jgi:DNA-binding response OmpR family regulator